MGEVAAPARLGAGLHAGGDERGAGAEAGHLGVGGELPEHLHVGMAGVAVVEDDRGVGEQDADEEVPHHPAGGGEPEDAVAGLGVEVEGELLVVARAGSRRGPGRSPSAARWCPTSRGSRAGGRTARGRRQGRRRRRSPRPRASGRPLRGAPDRRPGRGIRPGRCDRATASSARAPRRRRAGRSRGRRRCSRRPRAGPWARPGRSGRRRCGRRSRASTIDQIAPIEAAARKPISAAGEFGR